MRLPVIQGLIRRRILVNFRVQPAVVESFLPSNFRPKIHEGYAIAGICLIHLDQIRPVHVPDFVGISSQNAAHRVAVVWDEQNGETREGVFIPRRDTNSDLNHLLGGRLFPGEHHRGDFDIREDDHSVKFSMKSRDGAVTIELEGQVDSALPGTSIFKSLSDSSAFFEGGALGYSVRSDGSRLDGMTLKTKQWAVQPLRVDRVESSFFADESRFPLGSINFDHALIMRNIEHEWHTAEDMYV